MKGRNCIVFSVNKFGAQNALMWNDRGMITGLNESIISFKRKGEIPSGITYS